MNKEINIEEVLTELSYSWSNPEVQEFHTHIKEKKLAAAKKMLEKEGLSKEKVKAVMNHFEKLFQEKNQLVECPEEEFKNLKNGDRVIVSYGGTMFATQIKNEENLTYIKGNAFFEFNSYSYVSLKKAIQVWRIIPIKVATTVML